MHVPHALIPSIGASTAILVAGTASLGAVSGVVAYQGWPGVDDDDERPAAGLVAPGRLGRASGAVVLGDTAAHVRIRLADSAPRRVMRRHPRPAAAADYGAPAPAALPPSGGGAV